MPCLPRPELNVTSTSESRAADARDLPAVPPPGAGHKARGAGRCLRSPRHTLAVRTRPHATASSTVPAAGPF